MCGRELPNKGLVPAIPDAAHSIPRGLLCLLSGLAAQAHVRWAVVVPSWLGGTSYLLPATVCCSRRNIDECAGLDAGEIFSVFSDARRV
jgi:hypothetical protein